MSAPVLAANCSLLFTELPLLDRPRAAADAGFTGIEFWWPFTVPVPPNDEVDRFVAAIGEAGLPLVHLNFFAGDMAAGDRGVVSVPSAMQAFRDNVDVVVEIATRTGCRRFNALYGLRREGLSTGAQDEHAFAQLRYASEQVGRLPGEPGQVLLEPLSGVEDYPLKTAADVADVMTFVAGHAPHVQLGLLADLYHLAVNGDDVAAVIAERAADIGHVQLADHPGRHEPGTGALPLLRWVRALVDAGYRGPVAFEYRPAATTTEGLACFALGDFAVEASGDAGVTRFAGPAPTA